MILPYINTSVMGQISSLMLTFKLHSASLYPGPTVGCPAFEPSGSSAPDPRDRQSWINYF